MYFALLLAAFLAAFAKNTDATPLLMKRDFDDPRLFTSSFGKRSSDISDDGERYYAVNFKRSGEFDDPRMMSMAFGKRSVLPMINHIHRYAIFDKRSPDMEDPRFFSGAFGKRK